VTGRYWIKLWVEMLDDPKVAVLSDRLWRRWVEILLLAKLQGNDGQLPGLPQMAWRLRLSGEEVESDLVELARLGLVEHINGEWMVPNFAKRQAPKDGAERMRIHRQWRVRDVPVTSPLRTDPPEDRGQRQRTEAEADAEADAEAFGGVVKIWESSAGPITAMIAEHLADLAGEAESHRCALPAESAGALADGNTWVSEAIREAVSSSRSGGITVRFVQSILSRWMREGYKAPFAVSAGGSRQPSSAAAIDAWAEGKKHGNG